MANRSSEDEDINWDEIPPIGGLFILIFTAGIFLTMKFNGDMLEIKAVTILGSLLGVGYFGLRFNQIYHEDGLKKSVQWIFTAPADRNKNQFSSPDLGAMIPDGNSTDLSGMIPERKKTKTQGSLDLQSLRSMDEYKFEEVVGDVWTERGWNTQVTRASNDQGIDIVAEKEQPYHQKVLIQAKRYSKGNKVGSKEVQQYYSLKDQEDNVDQILIVTTSSFTKPAKRLAQKLNVKLIGGEDFLELYQENKEEPIAQ